MPNPTSPLAGNPIEALPEESVLKWLISALLILALLFWVFGWTISKDPKWPCRTHNRYRRLDQVGALLLASSLIAISLSVAWFLLDEVKAPTRTSLIVSPGLLAAGFAFFFSVLGYLNTRIVRNRQEEQIVGIDRLLDELIRELDCRALEARIRSANPDALIDVWMLDYAPGLGIRLPDDKKKKFKAFRERLYGVCDKEHINFLAVFSPQTEIKEFHEAMKAPEEDINEVNRVISEIDRRAGCIWRSPDIGPLHVIVLDTIVFQYIVIPGEKMSDTIAIKTEDAFVADFLRKTVRSSIEQAVTPKVQREAGKKITLDFKPQDNIEHVEIYLREDENFPLEPETTTVIKWEWPTAPPYCIRYASNDDKLADEKTYYLRCRLVKKPDTIGRRNKSLLSRVVALKPAV